MKKILLSVALLSSVSAFAQTADELKKQSIEACDTQVQAMPEGQRDMMAKMCKCTTEKTDYALILKAQSGDQAAMKSAQENAMKSAQECSSVMAG